ncbi:thioredoxin family protein [Dethiosulfovibrio salsuginis]|uniref:Thioredoxin 1 n=1 Tax=Dethiosulfovibrio salsuginis TaxID=561720 RepID=A0A1X7L4L2_9BACT|nr:thioredoxin family protein [Dethiosulfovibrio salsuginis]SMG48791.1 thioredoxin 1 [Dethiosulfovibrio salsuginis]
MDQNPRPYTKVMAVLLIAVVLGGIWLIKNREKEELQGIASNDSQQNPDFALYVTEELDLEKLKSYGLPIIIDFGADSCLPCKEMAPVLKDLNETLQGKAIVRFVDVWKYRNLAEGYPLRAIPTQFFFDKDGKPYIPSESIGVPMQMYSTRETNTHIFTLHEGGMTKEQLLMALKEMGVE